MTAAVWCAAASAYAPMVAHLLRPLAPAEREAAPRLSQLSLCGRERRRSWQPVDQFANPAAFTRCPACERLAVPAGRQ